jgi:hypothetical protein
MIAIRHYLLEDLDDLQGLGGSRISRSDAVTRVDALGVRIEELRDEEG